MSWGAFSHRGKTPIRFISHKMNAKNYVEVLNNILLSFLKEFHTDSWTYQQDNDPIYRAKRTKEFFALKNIPVLKWPAVSTYLNPMENLCSIIRKQFYKQVNASLIAYSNLKSYSRGMGKFPKFDATTTTISDNK